MDEFSDFPKRKPIALADFVADLRSLVFKRKTEAAEHFHLNHGTISRYENVDGLRAPLGYLASLAVMVVDLQKGDTSYPLGKPEYLLKEINRLIRAEYEGEAPFKNWEVLVGVANAYIQERNKTHVSKSEIEPGSESKSSTLPNTLDGTSLDHPLYVAMATQKFTPGSAPPVPSLIIGRDDDMRNLKQNLGIGGKAKASVQVLTAVKGWPGVGKTTIASALAYDPDIVASFPDGVLWASLGQEPNVLSEMATWGRALRTDEILKARSVEEAQNLLAGLLRNKRMLLIVDDIWKAEDAFPFKVGGPGCATLMTTRLDEVANALAPTAQNIYRLKVLNEEDAIKLVRELAPSVVQQHPAECLVLVQELEGLPLALQVAGRLLNAEANAGFGVKELIGELREGAKLLDAIAPADRMDFVTETTPTIGALLQKSLDLLDDATKDCYAYLGVFAKKPATFDMDAMKFVWQVEDPKPTIKALVDRGLLEFVPELARYQMHAVLVMLAKSLLVD
jgi:hypothetical protein